MLEPQNHWIYTWLDINGINDLDRAGQKLGDQKSLSQMQELARAWVEAELTTPTKTDNSILAARGIDLSGKLGCSNLACRVQEVDSLFRRVWHYFDSIVVDDPITFPILHAEDESNDSEFIQWIHSQLDVFLYLRDIGADDLVTYFPKPYAHTYHPWRKIVSDESMDYLIPIGENLIESISKDARIDIFKEGDRTSVFIDHDMIRIVKLLYKPSRITRLRKAERRMACIDELVGEHIVGLCLDRLSSDRLGLPLGSSLATYEYMFGRSSIPARESDVAFALDLPTLDGVDVRDVIRLRYHEQESFERFKASLRKGIAEYVKASPEESAKGIASQIRSDLVEPELRRVRASMRAAADAFARKSQFAVSLSVLATVVGASAGVAWGGIPVAGAAAAGSGLLAAGASFAALNNAFAKRADTEAELKTSDMWFLWKALEHAD